MDCYNPQSRASGPEIALQRVRDWRPGQTSLNLNCLGLRELPPIPDGVEILHCNGNLLTFLPSLPAGLKELWCGQNYLTHLPALPESLEVLYIVDNMLTAIPDLPASLTWLLSGFNQTGEEWIDTSVTPAYLTVLRKRQEKEARERITGRCRLYMEELMKNTWHPVRVEAKMLAGIDMEDM
jgi:hypothetical protein